MKLKDIVENMQECLITNTPPEATPTARRCRACEFGPECEESIAGERKPKKT